jgi:hypothetical protein
MPEGQARRVAVRVTLLAVTVGAIVAGAAAVSGAGSCAPSAETASGGTDMVCYHLVRTLAERVGIATAVLTAILALTVIGLSRLVSPQTGSGAPDRPR